MIYFEEFVAEPDKSGAVVNGSYMHDNESNLLQKPSHLWQRLVVRTLCVAIDSGLSFNARVSKVCRTVRDYTRTLRHVRKCIYVDDDRQLAIYIASARLDYCKSVLYMTWQSDLAKLVI